MVKKTQVEIANFVCTFDSSPLVDNFELFYDVISKREFIKNIKASEVEGFRIIDLDFFIFKDEEFLVGRLVKHLRHESSQNLTEDYKLKKVKKTLIDDPSAIFLLRLVDHKLIFINETRKSPTVKNLEYAINRRFKDEYKIIFSKELSKYKDKLKKDRINIEERDYFEQWFSVAYPPVKLTITYLTASDSSLVLLGGFKIINRYILKIPRENDENAEISSEFIKSLMSKREEVGTKQTTSTTLSFTDTQAGVSKSFAKEMTEDVSKSGGMLGFSMNGKTSDGDTLNYTEEDFKVQYKIEVGSLQENLISAIKKFEDLVAKGVAILPDLPDRESIKNKVKEIVKKLKKSNEV